MNGLFAALATPIDAGGRVDLTSYDRLVEFLLAAGVDGVIAGGNRRLVAGIGGPLMRRVVKLGRMAIDAGAESLLLPAPFFFRYEQDDLRAYFAHVSREVNAPCLLYDLPDFTNPILPPTVFHSCARSSTLSASRTAAAGLRTSRRSPPSGRTTRGRCWSATIA